MPDPSIAAVKGRRVWDSRGRPTVEAEVHLVCGAVGRAIAPAGASRGSREAVDLRDGGGALGGMDVRRAVAHVNGEIAEALRGLDATRQADVDQALIALDGTPHKARLGGNATIAVSLAVLHAAAAAAGESLYRFLSNGRAVRLPLPQIQIFGGGAHAGRRVDLQDFMVMALGARSFDEALIMTAEVYRAAGALMQARGLTFGVADEGGWWPAFSSNEEAIETLVRAIEKAGYTPGDDVAIALDIAASEFGRRGRYRFTLEEREFDSDGLSEVVLDWIRRFPIVSVEDPMAEDDPEGMARFTAAVGARVQVVGDDFLVTNAELVEQAARGHACNAVLIKPNQAGTVTETRAAFEAGHRAGFGTVISARSGESEDVSIVHLCVGWDAGQLKVGSFARSERMAKWNEGLRIEQALGGAARFAGREVLPGPSLPRPRA
ncbi:MAG TPA: phosphopyruvate hydratase [Burkholderiales bacterium]|nr:phosphopyruvate hydratase [Burkholderiales bacterium]